jgi:hypothetical protein
VFENITSQKGSGYIPTQFLHTEPSLITRRCKMKFLRRLLAREISLPQEVELLEAVQQAKEEYELAVSLAKIDKEYSQEVKDAKTNLLQAVEACRYAGIPAWKIQSFL